VLGGFRKDPRTRAEAMALIDGQDYSMTDFTPFCLTERGAQRFNFILLSTGYYSIKRVVVGSRIAMSK
jgi:hypothetical protein